MRSTMFAMTVVLVTWPRAMAQLFITIRAVVGHPGCAQLSCSQDAGRVDAGFMPNPGDASPVTSRLRTLAARVFCNHTPTVDLSRSFNGYVFLLLADCNPELVAPLTAA